MDPLASIDPMTRPAPGTETISAKKIRKLVDSSFACRYADLAAMLAHSTAAVALLDAEQDDLPADLVVSVWTQQGNALRLTGSYTEAERLLVQAAALPVSDLSTRLHLLGVWSSLDRNTGRYDHAARRLASAIQAQCSIRNLAGEARLHILLGLVHLDAGDHPQALRRFRAALDLLTPASPPDLLVSAGHNILQTLIASGRLAAASEVLANLEPTYRRLASLRITANAHWMRARLHRAMSDLLAARLAYERAYALLKTQPLSPELAQLAAEMSDLIPRVA